MNYVLADIQNSYFFRGEFPGYATALIRVAADSWWYGYRSDRAQNHSQVKYTDSQVLDSANSCENPVLLHQSGEEIVTVEQARTLFDAATENTGIRNIELTVIDDDDGDPIYQWTAEICSPDGDTIAAVFDEHYGVVELG